MIINHEYTVAILKYIMDIIKVKDIYICLFIAFFRKKRIPIFFLIILPYLALGQKYYSRYTQLTDDAYKYFQDGKCHLCMEKYDSAFILLRTSDIDRLRSALCAFECGNIVVTKIQISKALKFGFNRCQTAFFYQQKQYPEFHKHKEFAFILSNLIEENKNQSTYNKELAEELLQIRNSDQQIRQKIKNTTDSTAIVSIEKEIHLIDSLNLLKIEKIFSIHGYPGTSKVGVEVENAAFLVIQHAPLPIQEKYFTLIKEAVEQDELDNRMFILLIDRIKMRKGEKQIYGSQLYKKNGILAVYPIEDELNVNHRREQIGLEPIEEYVKRFGINWLNKN